MNNEAFVYRWDNLTNGKSYIGYHKGTLDDGYISSSHSKEFWDDFDNVENVWERVILFNGTKHQCLEFEQNLLKEIDIKNGKYYNNARGAKIIFSEDVLGKMSKSGKNRWANMDDNTKKNRNEKISKTKTGVKRPKEIGEKLSRLFAGKSFVERFGEDRAKIIGDKISKSNTGKHYHTEEYKNYLSSKFLGNKYGQNQSEETKQKKRERFLKDNPGKNPSEETRKKMSETRKGRPSLKKGIPRKKIICPYCGKEGGSGVMNRWHFDNCKNK